MVPVSEKGRKIGQWFLMVHIMMGGSSPEGEPMVWHKGEVKTYMGLYADNDGKLLEAEGCQRVAIEDPWRGGGEETYRDQLPWMQILGHPAAWTAVLVMHRMHMAVQEPHLVVRQLIY